MLSINTNIPSLIAQNSLNTSTNKLNQAIERLTTGFKINHAKDNAANYSISTNMTTELGSYEVAANNVAMGMDLVNTASDTLNIMSDNASRLHALCIQAKNGTYGAASLAAIQAEANSILAHISMTYNNAEYNGVKLFNKNSGGLPEELATNGTLNGKSLEANAAEHNGFIVDPVDYSDSEVAAMTSVADVVDAGDDFVAGETYSITTVDELVSLANWVNDGNDTTDVTFVLGADLDLSDYGEWTPIGDSATDSNYVFRGTFDGNGHTISNLYINRPDDDYQGLFGYVENGTIKNIKLKDVDITGADYSAPLAGDTENTTIENCCTVGGKVYGDADGDADNIGGLVGDAYSCSITNCYTTCEVESTYSAGGIVGSADNTTISNSYASGNITANNNAGGIASSAANTTISNSYTTGSITSEDNCVGGIVGQATYNTTISNCYTTGIVTGYGYAGGIAGYLYINSNISNSYAIGNITSTCDHAGGIAGYSYKSSINNCYAIGNVTSTNNCAGGVVGQAYENSSISNSYSTGIIITDDDAGGIAGDLYNSTITNCYSSGSVTSTSNVAGGIAGYTSSANISNSYSNTTVTGKVAAGGVVGTIGDYASSNNTCRIENTTSYSEVSGEGANGSFIGRYVGEYKSGTTTWTTTLELSNCKSLELEGMDMIEGYYKRNGGTGTYTKDPTYDLSPLLAQIQPTEKPVPPLVPVTTHLQVGIHSGADNQISFDTSFTYDLSAVAADIGSDDALNAINTFLAQTSAKATELGAVSSRLDSALESIRVNIENLTSSRSTLRDADVAKESSEYIMQQILQNASATLLATANQTPAIALQLI